MVAAGSSTSAWGTAAAAAAVGRSSQGIWSVLWGPGIAPHPLGDTSAGIGQVFVAAASAGGKTSLLSLEEKQGSPLVTLSPTQFSFWIL